MQKSQEQRGKIMGKKSKNELMNFVPDSDGKIPTQMLDISASGLEFAKTVTSSVIELQKVNAELEMTRHQKEIIMDANQKKFDALNKAMDKTFGEREKVLNMASDVISDGIKKNKDYMVLDALHTAAGIVTNNPFSQNPDFRKQLDAGERLELGNE